MSRPPKPSRATAPQVASALGGLALLVILVVLIAHNVSDSAATSSPTPHLPALVKIPSTTFTLKPQRLGSATGWRLPKALLGPRDVAMAPDGTLWISEQDTGNVDTFDGSTLTRYNTDKFPDTGAFWLAAGPDDAMWFSGYTGGSISRIMPGGLANGFSSLSPSSATLGIAQGPRDVMWVTDVNRSLVIQIPPNGVADQLLVSPPNGSDVIPQPGAIVMGPDSNMWFTDPATGSVGRIITSGTPTIEEFHVGAKTDPHSIAAGADSSLWITLGTPREIAKIDPSTGAATRSKVPAASGGLNDILVAPDGSLWVSEQGPDLLHLRTDGSLIAKVKLPAGARYADGIALDSDGTLWAAATDADMVVAVAHAA